jgi:DNA-binding NarL/FixJ family response regulator
MARTVLIVDDHEPFRERARALLQADGFEVVGEAADGETAVEAAHRLAPQVVLLDVRLPGIDGFEVAERLSAGPDPPVVVLISSRAANAYRHRLQDSSARGFIAKVELSGERLSSLLA